jgi:intein/homing endonuclease
LKKQKLPIFAEALSRNLSGLYYQFLEYKVKMRENITLECKGVQRCISGDTLIKVSYHNNIFKEPVEKLNRKFKVLSFNFKKNKIEIADAEKFDSGKRQTFRIKTKSGKTVLATKEHRFFVHDGSKIILKTVDKLSKGDRLVIIK